LRKENEQLAAKLQSVEEVVRSLAQCVQGIISENDKRVIKIYDTHDVEKKHLNEAINYLTEM
jgi:cystathionine beta-lyase family protein involved in aluminum resistance